MELTVFYTQRSKVKVEHTSCKQFSSGFHSHFKCAEIRFLSSVISSQNFLGALALIWDRRS